VTGDVSCKKYIMLTNLTSYVHRGTANFFEVRDCYIRRTALQPAAFLDLCHVE
jgi:hypothetical protein